MSYSVRNIVLCISFGHSSEQVSIALTGALEYAERHRDTRIVVVDDCSGTPPVEIEGVTLLETPTRRGFAGAVNYVLDSYPDANGRLLLINPDACVTADAVERLLDEKQGVSVPLVLNPQGDVENVRLATSAREQIFSLIAGEKVAARFYQRSISRANTVMCPPYAPSGSVMAYPVHLLREIPLRPEFFWLEQSDWIYRYANLHGPLEVTVLPVEVSHTGASTSLRYPVSVAASQLRTKVNFIGAYGTVLPRLLTPLGVLLRSVRFAIKTRRLSDAWFLIKVAAGSADWRVDR